MQNRQWRREVRRWKRETVCLATTSRGKRRYRRSARKHAKLIASYMPEKAAIWRKRARNG